MTMRDVIGVGFGPANLALAIALSERAPDVDAVFLERSSRFSWHRGMLLPEATMQISFLKDLATPRDPRSAFTFLSYLHERGRLDEFVNRRRFHPSRREFHDYLEWAAMSFGEVVSYGSTVTAVRPLFEAGRVTAFEVESMAGDGEPTTRRARTVVLASGLRPRLPDGVVESARVWHSAHLMTRLAETQRDPRDIVVVGGGQSAAEAVAHLHAAFPDASVMAVLPRFGYPASDDSMLVNRLFDREGVDRFYAAPSAAKRDVLRDHGNSNYSVVDHELIDELHSRMYEELVSGAPRLRMRVMSRLLAVRDEPDRAVGIEVVDRMRDESATLEADLVVLATGYEPVAADALLEDAEHLCRRDPDGELAVGRDYRLELAVPGEARVFVQGGGDWPHGITTSLLSVVATRADTIATSLAV